MPVDFYDHSEPCRNREGRDFLSVGRTYLFAWSAFDDSHWQRLEGIYQALPGSVRYREGIPYWFGADHSNPPALSASVEPTGLQVDGDLPEENWGTWNEMVRSLAEGLPQRDL